MIKQVFFMATALASLGAQAQGQVNIICSVQAEQCNLVQTVFAKSTGIKVSLTHKASGEAMAQLNAEKANPKPDFAKAKMIKYDYAKYGSSAERKRLIGRWEKEVNSLPR